MGALYKGLYRRGQVFWLRYSVAGKQVRCSLETEDEHEAVLKATMIRQRPELAPVTEADAELALYLEAAFASGRLTRNSIDSRKRVLEKFLEQYDVSRISQITVDLTQRWYRDLIKPGTKKVTETTAQGYVMRLRGWLSHLVKEHKLRENPAVHVRLNRIRPVGRRNYLSANQVASLIEDAPTDELRFILYCGFHAGMRKLEIIEARPQWFNLIAGSVTIEPTETFVPKDREIRTIPLTREFREFLKGYGLRSPFMLRPENINGTDRYRYDFRRPFSEYIAKKKMTCTAHDMRRTFASLRVQAGVSVYKVAKWLGDGVQVVSDHYGHMAPQDDDIELVQRRV